jgi:transposase
LKPVLNGLKKAFAKAVAAIDKAILRRLKEEPELARHADMLKDIPGIGPVVSAALATLLSRHPFASADAAVAFVGLDPRPRESGTWRGQRKLSKRGPTEIRRLLYVAAMTTARNVAMRGEIDRHKAKGLSATAIYNIIARKLLRTAWSMLKHQTPFAMDRSHHERRG